MTLCEIWMIATLFYKSLNFRDLINPCLRCPMWAVWSCGLILAPFGWVRMHVYFTDLIYHNVKTNVVKIVVNSALLL